MSLPQYGVAIGTFVSFQRDAQDQFGRWYHGHLTIATPEGQYASALDVDTPSGVGVSYRVSSSLATSDLDPVASLGDGWHALAPSDTTGAIDYLRSPMLQDRFFAWSLTSPAGVLPIRFSRPPPLPGPIPGPRPGGPPITGPGLPPKGPGKPKTPWWVDSALERLLLLLGRASQIAQPHFSFRPWVPSTGDNALTALENALPGSTRIYLFGEHYEDGSRGVHDVHMNQGDPIGSQFAASDGIWQDGAVFAQRANGTVFGWQVKFNTQSMKTDNAGHPI